MAPESATLFFSLLTRPMSVSFRWQVLLYFKASDSWARIEPLIWLKSAINRRMQLRRRTSGVSLLRHLGKRSKKASFNGRLTRHQSQKTMAVRHKACASPPGVTSPYSSRLNADSSKNFHIKNKKSNA